MKAHLHATVDGLTRDLFCHQVVESHKLVWKAESKINSMDNLNYREHSPTRSAGPLGRRARSRSSTGKRTAPPSAPPLVQGVRREVTAKEGQ